MCEGGGGGGGDCGREWEEAGERAFLVTSNGGGAVWAAREAAAPGGDGRAGWVARVGLPAGRAGLVCVSDMRGLAEVVIHPHIS